METVLVVGATGNIGTATVICALIAGHEVLAIVRNADSATKLFESVGSREGITTIEANVMSDTGVQSVVDQVKAGKLPSFQHVYAAAGGSYLETTMVDIDLQTLHEAMTINFESNFFAYRATVPYLLEQKHPTSTWMLCTGAQGEWGYRAAPALTQGALFSMANIACRDLLETNLRFAEVFLGFRIEVDASAIKNNVVKASDFAKNYRKLLGSPEIRSCRDSVMFPQEIENLNYKRPSWCLAGNQARPSPHNSLT